MLGKGKPRWRQLLRAPLWEEGDVAERPRCGFPSQFRARAAALLLVLQFWHLGHHGLPQPPCPSAPFPAAGKSKLEVLAESPPQASALQRGLHPVLRGHPLQR